MTTDIWAAIMAGADAARAAILAGEGEQAAGMAARHARRDELDARGVIPSEIREDWSDWVQEMTERAIWEGQVLLARRPAEA